MAVNRSLKAFVWRSEVHVLAPLIVGWFLSTLAAAGAPTIGDRIAFSLAAAGGGLLTLSALGYFDSLQLTPRRSDLLLVLFAVPIGGGIARLGTTVFDLSSPLSPGGILWVSIWVALVTYAGHGALSAWSVDAGKRRRIVLAVSPREREEILTSYFPGDVRRHVEFLPAAHLSSSSDGRPQTDVDLIIISRAAVRDFDAEAFLIRAHLAGIPIIDHRRILADLTGRIRIGETDLWTYLLEATPQTPLLRMFGMLKAAAEPIAAAVMAAALIPVFVPLMILIPWTSPGPIFYRQRRTGYLGREFTLIKFRSMRADAEAQGVRWASDNDDRTTKLGKFMRRTRLDELPQLWNVMRGEMSFCGPRPERPEIYGALRESIPLFPMRTVVRPGITGWAQVYAGYAASIEESALKLEYDLYYIQNVSPRLDFIVLLKTLQVAILGDARPPRENAPAAEGVSVHERRSA